MFIQRIHKKTKNKTYTSVYLVENYREDGKVKHRLISNLSKWPTDLVNKFEKVLKKKELKSIESLELSNSKSVGAIFVINGVAKKLGIKKAIKYHHSRIRKTIRQTIPRKTRNRKPIKQKTRRI